MVKTVPPITYESPASELRVTEKLRLRILERIQTQGLSLSGNRRPTMFPAGQEDQRALQQWSRREGQQIHHTFLQEEINKIRKYSRDGNEIDPSKIQLELRPVKSASFEERMYRWWNLVWWSSPYQRPVGRQLRFLLWDIYHDAPFGLIGLHSAPLRLAARDDALNIKKEDRDWWVNMSLSAQRIGALPPYNDLLGGKMAALAVTANEVRESYQQKYEGHVSQRSDSVLPANLYFVSTWGSFGRASIYNRLTYKREPVVEMVGYTKGSGTFHVSDRLYEDILEYLRVKGVDVTRGLEHGGSRKRQLLAKAMSMLDLPELNYHGIAKPLYIFPQVSNLRQVIAESATPDWYNRPFSEMVDHWQERWAEPRALRLPKWREFSSNEFFQKVSQDLKLKLKPQMGESRVA